MEKEITISKSALLSPVLLTGQERLELLRSIRGMWKDRTPDPIEELEKMRQEWDREVL